MRVLGLLAALAILASLPPASAQVPTAPEALGTACATVGTVEPQARDLLPICDLAEPAPAQPAEEAEAAAPGGVPATPQDAQQLAGEIVEDAAAIPEDPASAPERLLSIVATIVQFVKDLLALPGELPVALGELLAPGRDAIAGAATAAREATGSALDAVADAAAGAVNAVRQLFAQPASAPDVRAPSAPRVPAAADDATSLVGGLVERVL